MKRHIQFGILLALIANGIFAQEQLFPLLYNTHQHTVTNTHKSDYVYNNILIQPDTIALPFIDDFSQNTLLPYTFAANYITDTLKYAIGSCINNTFTTQTKAFRLSTSYDYFFDVANQRIDSVPFAPITVNVFDNSTNCFPTPSSNINLYPQPYFYIFDSITGAKLDSTLLPADTILEYATIYFSSIPTHLKWVDNYAYINNTFPINPISIGVATLDGLNEEGLPYNNSVVNAYGDADVLTSKPIDLSGLHNDSAVYLSFFVQYQGLGDYPNLQDSLVLEFKNEYENQWVKVWGITTATHTTEDFKQYYVQVLDTNLVTGPRYFYNDFQFRFRNKGSISGNNDHWHLDYIRLDKNRAIIEIDTIVRDVAFMYDFPNVLERYTMLPWSQFQAYADRFADTLFIPIRDNGQVNGLSAGAFPIEITVIDSVILDTIYHLNNVNFNPTSEIKNQTIQAFSDFVKPTYASDSVTIHAQATIAPTNRNFLTSNDSIHCQLVFDNVMAYDDGSAEIAYGLSGGSGELKKFAYKYNVAHPDTLAAIQIHFSNIAEDVSNLVFNLYAWDSIEVGQPLSYENVIGSIENQSPSYIDAVNGFATYAFDTPILVTGDFYIGYAQTDSRNLHIGYDKNSKKGHPHMYVYTNSTWNHSTISQEGSPMIRAVIDGDFNFTTSIQNTINHIQNIRIYPNPTQGLINLDIHQDKFSVSLYDFSGKLLLQSQNEKQLDFSHLPLGMYLMNIEIDGERFYHKIIKE